MEFHLCPSRQIAEYHKHQTFNFRWIMFGHGGISGSRGVDLGIGLCGQDCSGTNPQHSAGPFCFFLESMTRQQRLGYDKLPQGLHSVKDSARSGRKKPERRAAYSKRTAPQHGAVPKPEFMQALNRRTETCRELLSHSAAIKLVAAQASLCVAQRTIYTLSGPRIASKLGCALAVCIDNSCKGRWILALRPFG